MIGAGEVFGRWTVEEFTRRDKSRNPYYRCRCECGTVREVTGHSLTSDNSRSCGCGMTRSNRGGMETLTSMPVPVRRKTDHPLYSTWVNIRARCRNSSATGYRYYGGMGLTVCPEWDDFSRFVNDVGRRPTGKFLAYTNRALPLGPGNFQWLTAEEINNRE